jgi:hypothetical protein
MRPAIKRIIIGLSWLLSLILVISPNSVSAQKRSRDGVIRLEETVIEGRVAKPNAFFINTRQAMVYETMMIKESFIPEISKAVKKGPF